MDFETALTNVIADLTPQPWDHTTPNGQTLTVIPAGLREDPGRAEVMIRISRAGQPQAEIGIPSATLPDLIAALEAGEEWTFRDYEEQLVVVCGTAPGMVVVDSTYHAVGGQAAVAVIDLPVGLLRPLASALSRALDVARSWES